MTTATLTDLDRIEVQAERDQLAQALREHTDRPPLNNPFAWARYVHAVKLRLGELDRLDRILADHNPSALASRGAEGGDAT